MKEKFETLCELKKETISENIDEISRIIDKPKYICKKCARAANEKKYLSVFSVPLW